MLKKNLYKNQNEANNMFDNEKQKNAKNLLEKTEGYDIINHCNSIQIKILLEEFKNIKHFSNWQQANMEKYIF